MDDFTKYNSIFSYDSDIGHLYWKIHPRYGVNIGDIAGYLRKNGYVHIMCERKPIAAHRLAWLLTHKEWPKGEIDHINGIRNDNRLCNLRDVSSRVNGQNKYWHRNGKLLGARYDKRSGNWNAYINIEDVFYSLGCYPTEEQASVQYKKACALLDKDPLWRPSLISFSNNRGYTYDKKMHKYCAKITCKGVYYFIGWYDTPEEAHNAYTKVRAEKFEGRYKEAVEC
jgi:hypothetical protein